MAYVSVRGHLYFSVPFEDLVLYSKALNVNGNLFLHFLCLVMALFSIEVGFNVNESQLCNPLCLVMVSFAVKVGFYINGCLILHLVGLAVAYFSTGLGLHTQKSIFLHLECFVIASICFQTGFFMFKGAHPASMIIGAHLCTFFGLPRPRSLSK